MDYHTLFHNSYVHAVHLLLGVKLFSLPGIVTLSVLTTFEVPVVFRTECGIWTNGDLFTFSTMVGTDPINV
jgi:hypothetical protein